jgi:Protein of unknown function (DUF3987)
VAEMGYSKGVDAATQAKASAATLLHKLPSKLLGNGRLQIFRENALQLRAHAEHIDLALTAKELQDIATTYGLHRDPADAAQLKQIIETVTAPIVTEKIKAEVKAKPQAPVLKAKTGNAKPMNGTGDFPGDRPFVSTPDPTPHTKNPDERGHDNAADTNGKADGTSSMIASDPVDLWAKFDPPTLPRSLLPDVIERFAYDQGMTMGADMAGIAVGALVVCAAAIPDKIKLQVKRHNPGWLESARLWVALVGPVSAKKSPIMSSVVRPLRRIDSEMARRYSEERGRLDKLPAEERKQTNPPKQTRLLLQDTTIEAAQEILKDSPDGMLCYQDELSGWFGSIDKYSGARGAAKDRAFWLEAFNGQSYSVNRIGRGAVFIENLSVSILGGIQPEPIRKLADENMDDERRRRNDPPV